MMQGHGQVGGTRESGSDKPSWMALGPHDSRGAGERRQL